MSRSRLAPVEPHAIAIISNQIILPECHHNYIKHWVVTGPIDINGLIKNNVNRISFVGRMAVCFVSSCVNQLEFCNLDGDDNPKMLETIKGCINCETLVIEQCGFFMNTEFMSAIMAHPALKTICIFDYTPKETEKISDFPFFFRYNQRIKNVAWNKAGTPRSPWLCVKYLAHGEIKPE